LAGAAGGGVPGASASGSDDMLGLDTLTSVISSAAGDPAGLLDNLPLA
jgi:hypothetical protein